MTILIAKEVFKRPEAGWDYDANMIHATGETFPDNENCRSILNNPSQTFNRSDDKGTSYETFVLKKNVLQSASPYFVALENFKEGKENRIILTDTNAASFSIFADWVNTGRRDWQNPFSQNVEVLVHAYALGRLLMVPNFQNFVMDEIREFDDGRYTTTSKLLELPDLGFTRHDQIVEYFIDRIAYLAATSDFWSLYFPMPESGENQELLDSDSSYLLMPLFRKVAEFMRQLEPFATDADFPIPGRGRQLTDPRIDESKTYHIPLNEDAHVCSS